MNYIGRRNNIKESIFQPVMNIKNSRKITNNNNIETNDLLREIRAKKIEEKRASIEERRQKVTKFSNIKPFDEKTQNFTSDKNLQANENEDRTHTNTLESGLSMPGLKLEFAENTSDVLNVEDMNTNNELTKEFIYEDDKILMRKKKSNNWIKYKKNLFDKASSVYLQSRNAKEFLERRKSEELEEKRNTVNKIRNFHITSMEKRQQKRNSLVNKKSGDIIEIKEETKEILNDNLNLDETESHDRETSEEENEDESVTEQIEETVIENEEFNEIDEENVSKYFTDSDQYESMTDSESDDDKEEPHQYKFSNNIDTPVKIFFEDNLNENKENDINKLKKEIRDAFIIIKACENLKNNITKDIPMDILQKIDKVKTQRKKRQERIENLRRSRFEQAEQMRVDSRLAQSVVRIERELRVNDTRRRVKDSKKNSRQSEPQVKNKKTTRWIQERQLIERNVAARLEEEIKFLQKQL